ncbi:hypothetical protein [Roseateles toxinivorans]|uniref:Lipoprotein n=1 Tax=Roseateles toxinivorans TaxID=270368 RepID=A0A4V3CT88_9BURK|nr:hypothetical protein [Roseateles toxinivorans]TDP64274.1 hypothetical protein DES47_104563 [Roseateles toxinivorans]
MKPEKLVFVVALSALVTSSLMACRRVHRHRLQAVVPRPKSEAMQTWEGEGGNLRPAPQQP